MRTLQAIVLVFAQTGLLLLPAGLAGCSRSVTQRELNQTEQYLSHIGAAYGKAAGQLGHSPQNVNELKPFLKEFGNPDEILRSPSDGEPFVIIWKANLGVDPGEDGKSPILAYEKIGAGGKRYVVDIRAGVMEMTDEEFAKAAFSSNHKPSPTR